MKAECPLTIWCSAMTSSPSVGTYCLFPTTMWKDRLNHTLHFWIATLFTGVWMTLESCCQSSTPMPRCLEGRGGRGAPLRECQLSFFSHMLPSLVKVVEANILGWCPQCTNYCCLTCYLSRSSNTQKKTASCDTAELSTVNSGIQPNHQPLTKSDAWWEKWPGLIPSGLQNCKRLKW